MPFFFQSCRDAPESSFSQASGEGGGFVFLHADFLFNFAQTCGSLRKTHNWSQLRHHRPQLRERTATQASHLCNVTSTSVRLFLYKHPIKLPHTMNRIFKQPVNIEANPTAIDITFPRSKAREPTRTKISARLPRCRKLALGARLPSWKVGLSRTSSTYAICSP